MLGLFLLTSFLAGLRCSASESSFSVADDLFAYPQYEVVYSETYILFEDALGRLEKYQGWKIKRDHSEEIAETSLQTQKEGSSTREDRFLHEEYEVLKQNGRAYFCTIPIVKSISVNGTDDQPSEVDQQKELTRATAKGRELLRGMENGQCLFYTTGWWTYSFCYNSQVRQFHALPQNAAGGRIWPPQEDPTTPAYILGKVEAQRAPDSSAPETHQKTDLAELQTKSETSYLVQKLDSGTPCDLTGKARKVEIEFHCNPHSTDRIGWIKETATCSYLMVIYTPRLCNDIAFVPPKESRAHAITCQEMLTIEDIPEWQKRKKSEASRKMIGEESNGQFLVGDVQIGAMNMVGRDGKKIERGRIVLTQDEKAETLIMKKDGIVSSVSNAELKKLDIDPEDIEVFRKELQKMAGSKDWKIERCEWSGSTTRCGFNRRRRLSCGQSEPSQ
jgi:Glucosidase II beta subunit-like protein